MTCFNLSDNKLGYKSGIELAATLGDIPANTTSVDLSRNSLYKLTGTALGTAFAKLPESVTSINLSHNDLDCLSGVELAIAFAGLPTNITSINLSGNYLFNLKDTNLAKALAALPISIQAINLSGNQLGSMCIESLSAAFEKLSKNLTSIDLSDNKLSDVNGTQLAIACSFLPNSITSINLSKNNFQSRICLELGMLFSNLPTNTESVNLSENNLGYRTYKEIIDALSKLPTSVTHINLSNNYLGKLSSQEQLELLSKLPEPIRKINLSYNQLLLNERIKDAEDKQTQLINTAQKRTLDLDLSENGLSLISSLLPAFLTGYSKGWDSKVGWHLDHGVISTIYAYLMPIPIQSSAYAIQNGAFSCLAIKHINTVINKMPWNDVLAYLQSAPSEKSLQTLKQTVINHQPVDTTLMPSIELFLFIAKCESSLSTASNEDGKTKIHTILQNMRAQALIFINENNPSENRKKAKDAFNQCLANLQPMMPLDFKSILKMLLIIAAKIGLITFAVYHVYKGTFFLFNPSPDLNDTPNDLQRGSRL